MFDLTKIFVVITVMLILLIPFWLFFIVPELEKMPPNFSYYASIKSVDNFYDEEKKDFGGEIFSVTRFYYETASQIGDVLLVKNTFDVRKPSGEKIFAVERLYGVDSKTGAHVLGYGDKDRSGYLFGPRNLQKQNYTYWHINYDNSANLSFMEEQEIYGLKVYRYETNYHADQTANLGFLPGVGKTRGITLDINLQVWLEPVTGRMIKYEDHTIAYYYNLSTGERLNPWNKFHNEFKENSIVNQIKIAKNEKDKVFIFETIIPLFFFVTAAASLVMSFYLRKERSEELKKNDKTISDQLVNNTKIMLVIFIILIIAAFSYLTNQQSQLNSVQQTYNGPVEKITIGYTFDLINVPIFVAQNKSYFEDEGLNITFKEFQSGQLALQTMLKDRSLDIVTVAPLPIMMNSFDRQDFSIIAITAHSNNIYKIIARKDKGIITATDLKGKKIGTVKGTSADFFLSIFLQSHNISTSEVEIVNLKPLELQGALENGQVDAISIWDALAYKAAKSLQNNGVTFTDPSIYTTTFDVVSMNEFAKTHPEAIKRFLKAIDKANEFIRNDPVETRKILAQRVKLSDDEINLLLDEYKFDISLDQSLLLELEDGAAWAINNNLTNATKVPNYLNYIYQDGLNAVKPEANTIIH